MSEKKVLIVDDAVFMRSMQKRIIAGSGDYEVYEAADGEEAVALYKKIRPVWCFWIFPCLALTELKH